MYKVTEKRLRHEFAKISRTVFDGELEFSAIDVLEIEDSDSEAGWCVPEDDGNVYLVLWQSFRVYIHLLIHLHMR